MSVRVWSTFEATKTDGSLVKFRIQDLPESRIDDAVDLLLKYFVTEESFNKAAGVSQNSEAMAESRAVVTESMKDPSYLYVACFLENNNGHFEQMVGVSSMALSAVTPEPFEEIMMKTNEMKTFFELLGVMSTISEVMKQLQISHFYDDRGLVVHPEYRRLRIATELLKSRRLACVVHNVAATAALMTSIGSLKAAEQDNWETVLEVDIGVLERQYGVSFEEDSFGKFMIWKNPQFTRK